MKSMLVIIFIASLILSGCSVVNCDQRTAPQTVTYENISKVFEIFSKTTNSKMGRSIVFKILQTLPPMLFYRLQNAQPAVHETVFKSLNGDNGFYCVVVVATPEGLFKVKSEGHGYSIEEAAQKCGFSTLTAQ